ncbi:endolytic transglycosylase MltG [Paenibacillus sp. GCM10027626]|uniref:endolytic transglycosylase MltG n=1 Tax=Paenibacillus sp. GCM10027626 TaxID=3273411 RepID=UPI00364175A2
MEENESRVSRKKSAKNKKRRGKPSRLRLALYVMLTMFTLFIIVVGGILFYVWNGLRPAEAGEPKQVELKRGMSPYKFAELLESEGIIRDAFLFKYYLTLKKAGGDFQAGVYEIKPGTDKDTIISMLNTGSTLKKETVRVTIPEGFTIVQIGEALEKAGLVPKKEDFIKLADKERTWSKAESVRNIPSNDKLRHRLEGYLFPETYEIEKGSTAEAIIERMLKELDRKLSALPAGWEEALAERGLDLHELLTIASLIEREVVVDAERPLVSSVIYNRLNQKMRLQIDATVQYLLDKPKERIVEKDLKVEGPYNTYQNDGLPPGPIAAPSLKSIQAALYPEDTDYLYYVTKKDGSNEHLFARTLKGHNENIRNSNKN